MQKNNCNLCPRNCFVDRDNGKTGYCGQTDKLYVARADLHMWEEPCISGKEGSGTVFFCGCTLRCIFCQNHQIALGKEETGEKIGKEVSIFRLKDIFLELQKKGANNINLVTGTHFVPQIIRALDLARGQGLWLPIVYNSSGYESVETIRMLEGYVDVYLPDLKYVNQELGRKYSHAPDYFEKASAAIEEMVRQIGELKFVPEGLGNVEWNIGQKNAAFPGIGIAEYQKRSEQGESLIMTRGVIVRHLLLPGCLEDSKRVIHYLLERYGERIFISMMNQYTPLPHVADYPELMNRVTAEEYEQLIDYALECGIENGFVQDGDAAQESFIPEFDGKGV